VRAAVFHGHQRAPEAQVDEAACLVELHLLQTLQMQRLAGAEDQVIERADAIEERPQLPLVREIDDLPLGLAPQL
jgi:hypothetical protein